MSQKIPKHCQNSQIAKKWPIDSVLIFWLGFWSLAEFLLIFSAVQCSKALIKNWPSANFYKEPWNTAQLRKSIGTIIGLGEK